MDKVKQIVSISKAVNWYVGNSILNPNNALRDNDKLMQEMRGVMEKLKEELKDNIMTHREFLEMIKVRGIHDKYYRYKKPEPNNCEICKAFGIKQRY